MDAFGASQPLAVELVQLMLSCEWSRFGSVLQQLKIFLASNFYFAAVADLITERITAAAY